MKETAIELIDKLMNCWSMWDLEEEYYLTVLAPAIVRGDNSVYLQENEREIIPRLREMLSSEEWANLPGLIAQRRAGKLESLASDEERKRVEQAKAEEAARARAEEEKRKREAEAERKRKEQERRDQERAAEERRRLLCTHLQDVFETDFLGADKVFTAHPDAPLLGPEQYNRLKADFARRWVSRNAKTELDLDQAAAVAAVDGDTQVVARAGSGKTRALVARTIFLQKHCGVAPQEIMLLAFNKNAAKQMMDKLAPALGQDLPHVMTFHALAYALVHPEEDLLYDDPSAERLGLSREVQEVIDEHIRSSEYSNRIRDLMLAHFREDWERIVDGCFQLTRDEFLAYRRSLPRESLKGDFVKSFGEKIIANTLFENDVEYKYERNFPWDGINYRPDFTIPIKKDGGVIIEYFGLEGDPDYDEMSRQKRKFWESEATRWTFMGFSPRDVAANGADGFAQLLLQRLTDAGIACRRLTEDAIWEKVKERDPDCFTSAMRTFVGRCRKLNLTPEELKRMAAMHTPWSAAEREFIDIGAAIYGDYLNRLSSLGKEDFDGLMWRSVSLLRDGSTRFARNAGREQGDVARLKFVMIDEFQDFSPAFFEMTQAIRAASPGVRFFCVGDDWQAINGFAGSDLKFFREFEHRFTDTARLYIPTNYRSAASIVNAGNAVMHGQGVGAKPHRAEDGQVKVYRLDEIRLCQREQAIHNGDEITPAVLRLVHRLLDRHKKVVILSRTNTVPWYVNYGSSGRRGPRSVERFLDHIRSYILEDDRTRVTASTVHKYKGGEGEAVIVLDAVSGSFPLIHPNWVFNRVFGDSIERIEDEERRLFYVAVTRAQDTLVLLTETRRESPYLDDIRKRFRLNPAKWSDLEPMPSLDGERLDIFVRGAYDARDDLKRLGYRWDKQNCRWCKNILREGFSPDHLASQPWVSSAKRIEVWSEAGELIHCVQ